MKIVLTKTGIAGKKEDRKSTTYVLSVSDNGVGMPEDLNIENLDSLQIKLIVFKTA